ncbi:MAG TPA: M48 family metalloprotease [Armatimonadota bacterium]|nr:M48 family metalloprotease [Armatimonadota bacterium]
MTVKRILAVTILVALLAGAALAAGSDDKPPYAEAYEKRVGAEAILEVEKEYSLLQDEEAKAKVEAMASAIAAVSGRPDLTYDVRLLDTDMVNAFSLPGATIYVTKGLLDEVQSDDELAGVLAHEIAHNCTYDALVQAERNKEYFTGSLAATIAAILLGGSSDVVSTVLLAGEYVRQGVLGGYSIDMERRADHHGALYLLRCGRYNPVGLVTFMERLAAKERREPPTDLGVFQTHPLAVERVQLLTDYLIANGVDINRRATTKWDPPVAEETKVDGQDAATVRLWDEDIFLVLAPGPDAETPMARAQGIVQRLTDLLAAGLQTYELGISLRDGNQVVTGRDKPIITVYAQDAQAQQLDAGQIALNTKGALERALFREHLNRLY